MADINSALQISKSYVKIRVAELNEAAFTAHQHEFEHFHREPGAEHLKWMKILSDLRKDLLVNRANECLRPISQTQSFSSSDAHSWSANFTEAFQAVFGFQRPINWKQVILILEYLAESMAQVLPSRGFAAFPEMFEEFDKHLTNAKVHKNQTVAEWWCSQGKDLLEKILKHQKEKPENQSLTTTRPSIAPTTSTLQFRNTSRLQQHHALPPASVDPQATTSTGLQATTSPGLQTTTSLTPDENSLLVTDGGAPLSTGGGAPLSTGGGAMVVGVRSSSSISMGEPSPASSGSPLLVVSENQPLQMTETGEPLATIVKTEPFAEPTQEGILLGDDVKTCGQCGYTRPYQSYVRLVKCWKNECEAWLCTIDNCPFLSSPGCLASLLEHIIEEHCACAMPGYCIVCGDTKPQHPSHSNLKCRCGWFTCSKPTCLFASTTSDELQVHQAQSRH